MPAIHRAGSNIPSRRCSWPCADPRGPEVPNVGSMSPGNGQLLRNARTADLREVARQSSVKRVTPIGASSRGPRGNIPRLLSLAEYSCRWPPFCGAGQKPMACCQRASGRLPARGTSRFTIGAQDRGPLPYFAISAAAACCRASRRISLSLARRSSLRCSLQPRMAAQLMRSASKPRQYQLSRMK